MKPFKVVGLWLGVLGIVVCLATLLFGCFYITVAFANQKSENIGNGKKEIELPSVPVEITELFYIEQAEKVLREDGWWGTETVITGVSASPPCLENNILPFSREMTAHRNRTDNHYDETARVYVTLENKRVKINYYFTRKYTGEGIWDLKSTYTSQNYKGIKIGMNEALKLVEDAGGKSFRDSVKSENCSIHIHSMDPFWDIEYSDLLNKKSQEFCVYWVTGEVKSSSGGLCK